MGRDEVWLTPLWKNRDATALAFGGSILAVALLTTLNRHVRHAPVLG